MKVRGIQTYFMRQPASGNSHRKKLMTVSILLCELALCVALVGWRVGLPTTPVLFATMGRLFFRLSGN